MSHESLLVLFVWVVVVMSCVTSLYALAAAFAMPRLGSAGAKRAALRNSVPTAVSVLKPLCGAEPRLYENLVSFCEQDHPQFELLLGVSSSFDPAVEVVNRLKDAFPGLAIELIVDSRVHGTNLKVSNLINTLPYARYDTIVVADSDISVTPDYLRVVTAPLADTERRIGVVTCLYSARGIGGLCSSLGALFINAWFAPSVRIANAGGSRAFGFGATLAFHKLTLGKIGGFEAVKDCLADDYMLARFAREQGLATVLSPLLVTTDVTERTIEELWSRETRWLRTIRSVNPAGFASLFITFTSLWLIVAAIVHMVSGSWMEYEVALFGRSIASTVLGCSMFSGIMARLMLHARSSSSLRTFFRDFPLIPFRDLLLAAQWVCAIGGSHVRWRDARVPVANPIRTGTSTSA